MDVKLKQALSDLGIDIETANSGNEEVKRKAAIKALSLFMEIAFDQKTGTIIKFDALDSIFKSLKLKIEKEGI